MTEWRSVVGYVGIYEVSDEGDVRSLPRRTSNNKPVRARLMKPRVDPQGYVVYQLNPPDHPTSKCVFGHVLVAEAFIGPRPQGHEVNHKDGNKARNVLTNLEYMTPSENGLHRCRVLGLARGDGNGRSVLTEKDIPVIRQMVAEGYGLRAIGRRFGVRHYAIRSIISGRTWSHVS